MASKFRGEGAGISAALSARGVEGSTRGVAVARHRLRVALSTPARANARAAAANGCAGTSVSNGCPADTHTTDANPGDAYSDAHANCGAHGRANADASASTNA